MNEFKNGICLIFLICAISSNLGFGQTSYQYIRKNASKPEAQEDLKALRIALKKMRALDCDDPLSWYYQGGMHWVPDKVENNQLCESYTRTPEDLKKGWNNCTHDKHHQIHFLSWHRFYIYHFERIVRHLSGKSDFALPYWNYTNKEYRIMPEAFRIPYNNALYEASRLKSLNSGHPIHGGQADELLDTINLFEESKFSKFNRTIDRAPHGFMHNYIGGIYAGETSYNPIYQEDTFGLMALVPSAAFDPIFWVHHASIDYLWTIWTDTISKQIPIDTLRNNPWPYLFFDENRKEVSYSTEEVVDKVYDLDYIYDVEIGKPSKIPSGPILAQQHSKVETRLIASVNSEVIMDSNVLDIDIRLKKKIKHPSQFDPNNTFRLEIEVTAPSEPQGVYSVYVNLPEAGLQGESLRLPKLKNDHLAGHMTFFGAGHHAAHHGTHSMIHEIFTYDVSHEFIAHKAKKKKKNFRLSIRRSSTSTEEQIKIKRVRILQEKTKN